MKLKLSNNSPRLYNMNHRLMQLFTPSRQISFYVNSQFTCFDDFKEQGFKVHGKSSPNCWNCKCKIIWVYRIYWLFQISQIWNHIWIAFWMNMSDFEKFVHKSSTLATNLKSFEVIIAEISFQQLVPFKLVTKWYQNWVNVAVQNFTHLLCESFCNLQGGLICMAFSSICP